MTTQRQAPQMRQAPHEIAPFRGTEELILLLRDFSREDTVLKLISKSIEKNLPTLVGKDLPALFVLIDAKRNGGMAEFIRCVSQIDEALGLIVQLEGEGLRDQFRYRVYTKKHPFPNLKGHVDQPKLDEAFLRFKIEYFLGPNWDYGIYVRNDDHTTYTIFVKPEGSETVQP